VLKSAPEKRLAAKRENRAGCADNRPDQPNMAGSFDISRGASAGRKIRLGMM